MTKSIEFEHTFPQLDAEIVIDKVCDAIYKSELMPRDARDAVIDYIKESFNEKMWDTIENLIEILPNMPINIIEYFDIVQSILKTLI